MIQTYLRNNLHKYASKWLVLAIDVLVITISFIVSYFIRFNLTLDFDTNMLFIQLPVVIFSAILAFLFVGSYKGVVRHTGVRDVYKIFNAICLSSILMITMVLINREVNFSDNFTIPLGIIIIHSLLGFIGLTALRYVFKALYDDFLVRNLKVNKNVLIYGAGESGILTHNALTNHSKSRARVMGYIDNDSKKTGKLINGVKVYPREILSKSFLEKNNISEVIFSIQNIDPKSLRVLVEDLVEFPVQVKIVPPVEDWINGELKASQIKQVQIEDLLDRPPISIKNEKIEQDLKGKVILVTGGAGSIGSEIVRQICGYDYKSLIIIDQAESALYDLQQELKQNRYHNFVPIVGDIRDKNRLSAIFQEHKPHIVFHAAAYKHVNIIETNVLAGMRNNVIGTQVLAQAARAAGVARFILVSTDKAVRPKSMMGASKRLAELVLLDLASKAGDTLFSIVRFGNVLGSSGSVVPLFEDQIARGGPITLTDPEATRYFMTLREAAQLVLLAGNYTIGADVFVLDMGDPVAIRKLAEQMIESAGLSVADAANPDGDIEIEVIGLAPGEKLHEERVAPRCDLVKTGHPKIMRTTEQGLSQIELARAMKALNAALEAGSEGAARTVVERWLAQSDLENARLHVADAV